MIFGTFITITNEMMTDLLGYVGDLFTDVSPILLLVVAVLLCALFIGALISSFRH